MKNIITIEGIGFTVNQCEFSLPFAAYKAAILGRDLHVKLPTLGKVYEQLPVSEIPRILQHALLVESQAL